MAFKKNNTVCYSIAGDITVNQTWLLISLIISDKCMKVLNKRVGETASTLQHIESRSEIFALVSFFSHLSIQTEWKKKRNRQSSFSVLFTCQTNSNLFISWHLAANIPQPVSLKQEEVIVTNRTWHAGGSQDCHSIRKWERCVNKCVWKRERMRDRLPDYRGRAH